ncbi:MAG TPA: tail protein X [Ktedonobacterales bacterium]|nr:tail protein X [Ktedonobacterales bacterium]
MDPNLPVAGSGIAPIPGAATSYPPQPIPFGASIYISIQGDWWDLISLKVYGMRRGDEYYMHKLIEANYELRDLCEFPAGVQVIVPALPVKVEMPLVPWTSASIVTAP